MKNIHIKKFYFSAILITAILISFSSIGFSNGNRPKVKQNPSKKQSKLYLASFGDQNITLEEFNEYYYIQIKTSYNMNKEEATKAAQDSTATQQYPLLDKAIVLDEMIKQRIIYNKAKKEGYHNRELAKNLIKLQREALAIQFYINDKIKNSTGVNITEQELNDEYKLSSGNMEGFSADQIEYLLRQQITEKKYNTKAEEIYNLSKNKYKIEAHPELFDLTLPGKNKIVLKIINDEMTLEQFNEIYYYQIHTFVPGITHDEIDQLAVAETIVSKNPLLSKKWLLNEFIKRKVIYLQSKNENIPISQEETLITKFELEACLNSYYINNKIDNEIRISDNEISKFYEKHKNDDILNGYTLPQAIIMIRKKLYQDQFYQKYNTLTKKLMNETGPIKIENSLLK